MTIKFIDTLSPKSDFPIVLNKDVSGSFCHISDISSNSAVQLRLPYYNQEVGQVVFNESDGQFYKITSVSTDQNTNASFSQISPGGGSTSLSGDVTGLTSNNTVSSVSGHQIDMSNVGNGKVLTVKQNGPSFKIEPSYVDVTPFDISSISISIIGLQSGETSSTVLLRSQSNAITQYNAAINMQYSGYESDSASMDGVYVTPSVTGTNPISVSVTGKSYYNDSMSSITTPKNLTYTCTRGTMVRSKSFQMNFGARIYYGSSSVPTTVNSSFVTSLSASIVSRTYACNITISVANSQYLYIAIPTGNATAFPTLTQSNFSVGGFSGGFTNVASGVSVTNLGVTLNYDVWRSNNHSLGSTTVKVQ